jgi:hypothetical protein
MAEIDHEIAAPPAWLSLLEAVTWIVGHDEIVVGRARSVLWLNILHAYETPDPAQHRRLLSPAEAMLQLTQQLRAGNVAMRGTRTTTGRPEDIDSFALRDIELRERNGQVVLCLGDRIDMRWRDPQVRWQDLQRLWPPLPADVEKPTQATVDDWYRQRAAKEWTRPPNRQQDFEDAHRELGDAVTQSQVRTARARWAPRSWKRPGKRAARITQNSQ